MCNVLLKTLIKFKLNFFGVLIEKEIFWCLFHLNVIFASLSEPNYFHLYVLNIVLMLAFGLEMKKTFLSPTLHYSCFTLVCAKDIIK